ncbi:uncharacterized protein LOC104584844 isoform X2 [Brachypodium distachyon]|uniref:uncharacterized protein LOC104584844 isoform X2 n=1 Tax=Brachypodium distachyon TaxID=15368 RepID=UPI00071DCC18|nr:uncharacterized protein LOC104584844 isoform X2 [Brachypodium distachyon]|eukprot:XP_014758058.1 uncharacterized protein LOC104584844 isoform X2 [Brachypodium distachyon]
MRVQLVQMIQNLNVSNCQIAELGLGGPLVHSDKYFVGINIRYAKGRTWCLPFMSIRERLEQFRILTPRNLEGSDDSGNLEGSDDSGQEERDETNLYGAGSSSGTTETSSQGYSPPPGASMIVPSGFMRRQKWLDSMGYPRPPPLMLELNGRLLHTFEDFFGHLHAWKNYLFSLSCCTEGPNPWVRLGSNIVQAISRRVVSLASFNGATRFFACTGLLIKCRVGRHYGSTTPSRTVINSDFCQFG